MSDSACDSATVCVGTFAAVTDHSISDVVRLITKTPPTSTGNLTTAIEHFNTVVLESDDPFTHRFQNSTIAESVMLLATEHNAKMQKDKDSACDVRSVTEFPNTMSKVLTSVNLSSPDTTVQEVLNSEFINHATLLAYVGDILRALAGLEADKVADVDTMKKDVKTTIKKIDALFLITGLRLIEEWAKEIVMPQRDLGSKGSAEHNDVLQNFTHNMKQFLSLPKMSELLVPVAGQNQAVMSGTRTLNFFVEFSNFVGAICAVADICQSNSVLAREMLETMVEHIDRKQPDTLIAVSNMFVSYRCLMFAGTGLTEVNRVKAQMTAMLPKLEKHAPYFVRIMKSMEDSVLPQVSESIKTVEKNWTARMTTPTEKEQWEVATCTPSTEGEDHFETYEEDDDYMHLKKVCVLTYDAASVALLDVRKAVAAFANDLSRLSRKATRLETLVADVLARTEAPIQVDAVQHELLLPFSKMIQELGDIEKDYCDSSKRFVLMKNQHPEQALEFKMQHGIDVAGKFMNETTKTTLLPLALLTEVVKKAVPSNWEQVLASRNEQLIWNNIKVGPNEAHDKSCDCIAILGLASDIFVRMSSPSAGGTMPITSEFTQFMQTATQFRKYTASVMAADRIFSQIQALRTKSSRNDNYKSSPCLVYCFAVAFSFLQLAAHCVCYLSRVL